MTTLLTSFIQWEDTLEIKYENSTRYNVSTTSLRLDPGGQNPLTLNDNDAPGPAQENTKLVGTAILSGGVVV